MKLRPYFAIAATAYAFGTLVSPVAAADDVRSNLVDLTSCEAIDTGPGAFIHLCRDGGAAVDLYYLDGRGAVSFGRGGRQMEQGGRVSMDDPLPLGQGDPFGGKVEWYYSGGDARPCSGVVRVNFEDGSRLVVGPTDGRGEVLLTGSNDDARARAVQICGGGAYRSR